MNHHKEKETDDYTVVLAKPGVVPNSLSLHTCYVTANSVEQAQMNARIEAARNDLLVELSAHIDNYSILYMALGHRRNLIQHEPLPKNLP